MDGAHQQCAGQLEAWLAELLPRALDWAAARPAPVQPTRAGLLAAVLSQLGGPAVSHSRAEVAAALARGLGAHLEPSVRAELAGEVAKWACVDPRQLLEVGNDPLAALDADNDDVGGTAGTLRRLQRLPSLLEEGGAGGNAGGLVMTDGARRLLALAAPWLLSGEPFLLVRLAGALAMGGGPHVLQAGFPDA